MSSRTTVQKVKQTIQSYGMIQQGDKILVGVSGGADSVCLFHILYLLAQELGFTIAAAHLNHGLREAADEDEEFVKQLCYRYSTKVYTKREQVSLLADETGKTIEEAGRIARYHFFREISEREGYTYTATAHNRNDNAETVLLNLLRGSGIDGLCGIPYVREDGIIRPLLSVDREDIEAYCEENGLIFRTDESNTDSSYTRNRVRNELIPFLKEKFNPNIVDGLIGLSENVSEDAVFLNSYAERLFERLCSPMPNRPPLMLHIESLKMIQRSVQVRLVRLAVRKVNAQNNELSRKHIDSVLNLLQKSTGVGVDLPNKIRVEVQYGWLVFEKKSQNSRKDVKVLKKNEFCIAVGAEKSYNIEEIGKKFAFKVLDKETAPKEGQITLLDYESLKGMPLFLRSRRHGDKLAVFADGRKKSVKSLMIDKKIPREKRDEFLLLCNSTEVLAVLGIRVGEPYRVRQNTKKVLVITSEKMDSQ